MRGNTSLFTITEVLVKLQEVGWLATGPFSLENSLLSGHSAVAFASPFWSGVLISSPSGAVALYI